MDTFSISLIISFVISLFASIVSAILFIIILWYKEHIIWKKKIRFLIAFIIIKQENGDWNIASNLLQLHFKDAKDPFIFSHYLNKIDKNCFTDEDIDILFNSIIKKNWIIKKRFIKLIRSKY